MLPCHGEIKLINKWFGDSETRKELNRNYDIDISTKLVDMRKMYE